jgi:ABC-type glycerol-3-phosphate transport system substrate-binding protein
MKIRVTKVENYASQITFHYEVYSDEFNFKGETTVTLYTDPKPVNKESFYEAIVKAALKYYKEEKEKYLLKTAAKSLEGTEIPDEWVLDGNLKG